MACTRSSTRATAERRPCACDTLCAGQVRCKQTARWCTLHACPAQEQQASLGGARKGTGHRPRTAHGPAHPPGPWTSKRACCACLQQCVAHMAWCSHTAVLSNTPGQSIGRRVCEQRHSVGCKAEASTFACESARAHTHTHTHTHTPLCTGLWARLAWARLVRQRLAWQGLLLLPCSRAPPTRTVRC
jgi:hypothetical protein